MITPQEKFILLSRISSLLVAHLKDQPNPEHLDKYRLYVNDHLNVNLHLINFISTDSQVKIGVVNLKDVDGFKEFIHDIQNAGAFDLLVDQFTIKIFHALSPQLEIRKNNTEEKLSKETSDKNLNTSFLAHKRSIFSGLGSLFLIAYPLYILFDYWLSSSITHEYFGVANFIERLPGAAMFAFLAWLVSILISYLYIKTKNVELNKSLKVAIVSPILLLGPITQYHSVKNPLDIETLSASADANAAASEATAAASEAMAAATDAAYTPENTYQNPQTSYDYQHQTAAEVATEAAREAESRAAITDDPKLMKKAVNNFFQIYEVSGIIGAINEINKCYENPKQDKFYCLYLDYTAKIFDEQVTEILNHENHFNEPPHEFFNEQNFSGRAIDHVYLINSYEDYEKANKHIGLLYNKILHLINNKQ